MICGNCSSDKILHVSVNYNDLCHLEYKNIEQGEYAPIDFGLGGDDSLNFQLCFGCGNIQGTFQLLDKEEDD